VITPCEVAVKTVSPAIRALLAQNLLNRHDLKEIEVAQVLGISQSAVSKYNKKVRGNTILIESIPEVQTIADQMTALLMTNPVPQTEVIRLFCEACALIRSKGLMCGLCKQNQNPVNDGCDFCR